MKYPAERKTWLRENPFKRARRSARLHTSEVALQVGVEHTTYRRWECGMRRPTPEHMKKLATVLNVEPTTLIERYEIWRAFAP